MSYDYEVLGDAQIKLLDDYVPALSKLKFSQIIDEILNSTRNGMFEDLTLDNDLTVGRDAVITRNLTVEGSVSVGGGYGDTGWTADEDGNTDKR